jgi:hypothetical protein
MLEISKASEIAHSGCFPGIILMGFTKGGPSTAKRCQGKALVVIGMVAAEVGRDKLAADAATAGKRRHLPTSKPES